MEIIKLESRIGEAVSRAAAVLREDGVIVYPTDTLYGLGADAFSDVAVDKIYAIKGREARKPIHCVVADLAMVERYAEVNDIARKLAEKFLPGALTMILKKKAGTNGGIARGIDTIGIRIPNNEFCLELALTFGKPFTATSANTAGLPTLSSITEIAMQLGSAADLAVDAGVLPPSAPSTVVSLVSDEAVILREGAIPTKEILAA